MTTLTVGSGQQFRTIAAAVSASANGDTINVSTGTYLNDFVSIRHSLTIQGVGGPVSLLATYEPPNGKAIITEGASGISVTLSGLTIAGATVPDGNGAGIRYEGGSLLLDGVTLTSNQDGFLGASDPAGSVTIQNSVVTANGAGDGRTHGIYIGAIDRFEITNSTVSNTSVGHNIKSRAANNTITNNLITDVDGTASYLIDLPNGGNAQITGNTIEKGPNAQNPIAISYGEEGNTYGASSFVISNNLLINDLTGRSTYAVRNTTGNEAIVTGNTFYGWSALSSGAASLSGNTIATSPPALRNPGVPISDTQAAAAAMAIADASVSMTQSATLPGPVALGAGPDAIVVNISEDAWRGDAQYTIAVDGQAFGNVLTASSAHAAGQTQPVTLLGSFGTGQHTVTVTFLNDAYGGSAATDRNLYVDSISSGLASIGGAGLPSSGSADFVVNNTAMTDLATVSAPIAPLSAAPLPVAGVAATTVGSGPGRIVLHVSEDAWRGDAQFTVQVDGRQIGGTLAATAIHGAGQSQQFDILGDFVGGNHQVEVTFLNDAWGGTPDTDRNLYIDRVSGLNTVPGTALMSNGAAGFYVATAALPAFLSNPAPVTVGAGPASILLEMAEDAWRGDAQFTVRVDGQQLGGVLTTTALHSSAQTQQFDIRGAFAVGTHAVDITFINDAWGGSPDTDRNLYLEKLGATPVNAPLMSDGTQTFSALMLPNSPL